MLPALTLRGHGSPPVVVISYAKLLSFAGEDAILGRGFLFKPAIGSDVEDMDTLNGSLCESRLITMFIPLVPVVRSVNNIQITHQFTTSMLRIMLLP